MNHMDSDDERRSDKELVLVKWVELFYQLMEPSTHKLGIQKIKESKIYGPTYTLILAKVKKYFTTLNKFDLSDESEKQKSNRLFQLYIGTAVDRYRANLHRINKNN